MYAFGVSVLYVQAVTSFVVILHTTMELWNDLPITRLVAHIGYYLAGRQTEVHQLMAVEEEEGVEEERKKWEGRKHYESEVSCPYAYTYLTLSCRTKQATSQT